MSGVAIIANLLANSGVLTAAVPASRIGAGNIAMNTDLPAVGVKQISATRNTLVDASTTGRMVTERVQVTAFAKTYAEQKTLVRLVVCALANPGRTTIAGFAVDSVIPDIEGPDLEDDDAEVYQQSHDFMVRWHE